MKGRATGLSLAALLLFILGVACGEEGAPDPSASSSPPSPTSSRPRTRASAAPSSPEPEGGSPPARDLLDLARRFRGYSGPEVAREIPYDHQVGDSVTFTVLDLDNVGTLEVTATVRLVTEHAYFFVENGQGFTDAALTQIGDDFESEVWPVMTGSFGEPGTPGVDGDPRITILHTDLRGAGGYVSSSDGYPKEAVPRSNEREMLYLDASALAVPGPSYNALVAHELQHLIHNNYDADEESWVNEGLSEVAWEIAGGGTDGVWEFLGRPDIPLTFWPFESDVSVHYAASELFCAYLLDHYGGRENANDFVAVDESGVDGINVFLEAYGKTFNSVFADFVAANYLDADDGPYSHLGFDGTTTAVTEAASGDGGQDRVSQFGTDYIRIEDGSSFRFDGSDEASIGVSETDDGFWWSNRGDAMDSRLTREIDLTDVSAATLTFDLWYDIEPGWDYGYVAVSTDGGRTWEALSGEHATDYNPVLQSYGRGYTDDSDGWVEEEIDLSAYAGQEILLRFEYVTDDTTHLTGMAVDNIRIPEIGFEDAADSDGEWQAEGFRRIDGPLAQEFILQVVHEDGTVSRVPLDGSNAADIPLNGPVTIVISGATRGTAEAASYTWSAR